VPIPPEAVLFDMDGTLIDSEPIWFDTEVAILAEYGYVLGREHWVHVLGQANEIAVRYLIEVSGIPLTPRELNVRIENAMAERLGAGIELVPGAKELFTELEAAGVPCALVSASSRRIIEASLGSIGAQRFRLTVSGDDVVNGKPHPEPYLKAAGLLGVDPARCAVIEDSPNGSRSAAAAGCRVLAIPHAAPIEPHPLISVADSLAEVDLARLRALFDAPGPVPTPAPVPAPDRTSGA
jgi:HAD superfamily hydrolase (TIGR01509 family)